MKLKLKNVGKISEANIDINGITVIAGENDTGKSTIGKAFFAVFNSLYQIDQFVKAEKIEIFVKLLQNYCLENYIQTESDDEYDFFGNASKLKIESIPYAELAEKIYFSKNKDLTVDILKSQVVEFFYQYDNQIDIYLDLSRIDYCVERIYQRLLVSDKASVGVMVKRVLNAEFNGQFKRLNAGDDTEITLQIGRNIIGITSDKDELEIADSIISLKTELAYIDDPFVLDQLDKARYVNRNIKRPHHVDRHTEHLKALLLKQNMSNAIEEIIINDKLETIYDKINQISSGDVLEENSELIYKDKGNAYRLSNLSTGLKSFVIIKMLLLNGSITEKSTIILDEPEIHLHPEWQLVFAETIVLLQKEFNLHILMNTHSPYFLEALENYTEKYGTADRCKYYLSYEDTEVGAYTVKDVTDNTEEIYALLAEAFQKLENEF